MPSQRPFHEAAAEEELIAACKSSTAEIVAPENHGVVNISNEAVIKIKGTSWEKSRPTT